jgi:hypothetical protein
LEHDTKIRLVNIHIDRGFTTLTFLVGGKKIWLL